MQAMEIPDIQIVGAQFAQACVEVGKNFLFRLARPLARDDDLQPHFLQSRADHPLVISALITAGRVEVIDTEIRGALDHGRIGSRHAAESKRRHLQAGFAQQAIVQPGGFGLALADSKGKRRVG
jgi:hypothetical protein